MAAIMSHAGWGRGMVRTFRRHRLSPFWRREFDIEDLGVPRHIYVEPDETVPCATLLAAITESMDDSFDAEGFAAEHWGSLPAPSPKPVPSVQPRADTARPAPRKATGGRKAVTPAARSLARKLELDIELVQGTGHRA
jgi:pyruvate/2-oxoglutarate dehydrogenase complex dihydrolipoamide acyltransferase (E2) component